MHTWPTIDYDVQETDGVKIYHFRLNVEKRNNLFRWLLGDRYTQQYDYFVTEEELSVIVQQLSALKLFGGRL